MKKGNLILLLVFGVHHLMVGQIKTYEDYTSTFRYHSELDSDFSAFSDFLMGSMLFTCQDSVYLMDSDKEAPELMINKSSAYKEKYRYKLGVLYHQGYFGPDPFLSIPEMEVDYFEGVPLVSGARSDDFYNTGETGFMLTYSTEILPADLKSWCQNNSIEALRVAGLLQWKNEYKRKDQLNIFFETYQGFVIENKRDYSAAALEIKKGEEWFQVVISETPELLKYFSDKSIVYESLFEYQSIKEVARIEYFPQQRFYFQSERKIYDLSYCGYGENEIILFPNPTFGDVKIKFASASDTKYTLTINSIIGKQMFTKELELASPEGIFSIDLPALQSGMYTYTIRNSSGKTLQSRRLLVMEY